VSDAEGVELGVQLRQEQETNLILQESIADLELALEDRSWDRITGSSGVEFSGVGRRMIVDLCRAIAVVNPLVKRGLMLRIAYIWGGGVQVAARDDKVAEVIGDFWDDNTRSLTGTQAQEELERALGTDGNVYLAAFTSPLTGRVQVRSTPTAEIVDIVTNPEDSDEPWFYVREYSKTTFGQGGTSTDTATRTEQTKDVHPALGYRPSRRIKQLNGHPVLWDAPMLHVSVNRLDGWSYGVPDVYAAMAWARAYKDFLTDWALLTKSLAKFAWKLTGDTKSRANKAIEAARAAIDASSATTIPTSNLNTAGQIAGTGPGMSLDAIPKSGATIDADSGKPLAAMVAAGLGVPVTLLLADPGITGARAVAETLDKPTVLEMELRRSMWQDQLGLLLDYVVDQAVIAPKGRLQGTVRVDVWGRRYVELAGKAERTVDWNWPPLAELDPIQLVGAITQAADYMPDETTTRLLLTALGVDDVDEILDDMRDESGAFVPPRLSVGQAAVDAFNRGEDPAGMVR
jgi:hypothetical protein